MEMNTPNGLHEVLYVSTIAMHAPISVVGDIAVQSRAANQRIDVTGLLIFDGMRFCQQLEGAQKDVLKLMERICQDRRHTHVEIVHLGPLAQRRFRQFNLGYATVEDEDRLARLEALDGPAAVSAFLALLSKVDI